MSSLRGHALATVAIAAGLALVTVSTAEARGGYRGGHYGGHHRHHGGWSTGSYVALGLGVAALGGALAYAATRPSYAYGYGYGPSYYSPYYYPPAYYAPAYSYAPYYYAPPAPYYYAPPPAYAPAPAPVAYPSYPPAPAYPTPVSYYYSDGTRTDAQTAAPSPYGNAPYSSNAYGTVVNPPSPYQTAVVPGVTAAPTTPVARSTLPTVYTVP